jgi:hypothetical protein
MPTLTRRRDKDGRFDSWSVYYGDVRVGAISVRAGVPNEAPQWGWSCGFPPGTEPRQRRHGIARSFMEARADFDTAWQAILPDLTEAQFEEWRRQAAFTAWKYAMWEAGCKMPTQTADDRSRCFCGAEITTATASAHIIAAHKDMR